MNTPTKQGKATLAPRAAKGEKLAPTAVPEPAFELSAKEMRIILNFRKMGVEYRSYMFSTIEAIAEKYPQRAPTTLRLVVAAGKRVPT